MLSFAAAAMTAGMGMIPFKCPVRFNRGRRERHEDPPMIAWNHGGFPTRAVVSFRKTSARDDMDDDDDEVNGEETIR